MTSIKRFLLFFGAALSLISIPHSLSARTYERGSDCANAYEDSRRAPNVSPSLALGVVVAAGVIAIIATNGNSHHHSSSSHSHSGSSHS